MEVLGGRGPVISAMATDDGPESLSRVGMLKVSSSGKTAIITTWAVARGDDLHRGDHKNNRMPDILAGDLLEGLDVKKLAVPCRLGSAKAN